MLEEVLLSIAKNFPLNYV